MALLPSDPDRLSALDWSFLALDSPSAPLHVGWTMRFDGDPPPLAALRRHLDARLGAVPRFRKRVVTPAYSLGDPRWVDDPGFDIARHVHEFHADYQPIPHLIDLPDKDGLHRELAPDLKRVNLPTLILGDGAARHDAQLSHLRKPVGERIRHTVRYMFQLRVVARVDQRQDG